MYPASPRDRLSMQLNFSLEVLLQRNLSFHRLYETTFFNIVLDFDNTVLDFIKKLGADRPSY